MTTIVWFRLDLRLADNPALYAAAERGKVIPVYIFENTPADENIGGASKWWLHHSIRSLQRDLPDLVLLSGDPLECLKRMIDETGASGVYWNRRYSSAAISRDREIKDRLGDDGHEIRSFKASLLHEPWEVSTDGKAPYKVYTPFWNNIKTRKVDTPLPVPELRIAKHTVPSEELENQRLLPRRPDWAKGWQEFWQPGEKGAKARVDDFVDHGLGGYAKFRDRPDLRNVSRLSPHLHFGEISPRQLWNRVQYAAEENPDLADGADKFLAELGWREFSWHLLYHFPKLPCSNWRAGFDDYPWQEDDRGLRAWQQGKTGYPMVDAGMRELWQTGYMHNRARMLVASFLVKHLRIHWRQGAAWFWDTLVDADLANNSASWQWVAGSGVDAAPYFRIFNPVTQGKKFDPDGKYVRKWCPELARLDTDYIHAPFEAPPQVLQQAGIRLGENYPLPVVEHSEARKRALDGYEKVKSAASR